MAEVGGLQMRPSRDIAGTKGFGWGCEEEKSKGDEKERRNCLDRRSWSHDR